MYGVLLILVLIITGGAIAFIGDRLGSKVGKKRLSLFGLRPRHTSIIVTIVTGILITTTTLGVMTAVSKDVRTALFGMEKLNRTMMETKASLNLAQADLASAQQQKDEADQALAASQDEVEKLQGQQAALEKEQQRLLEGNRLLEEAKAALLSKNDELAAQNDNLLGLNETLAGQNEALQGENDALTQTNVKLGDEKKLLEKQTEALANGLITIREGDIVYRAGEVIASGVIRGNRDEEAVRADLTTLAQVASRNVSVRVGENKTDQDIWIYRPEFESAVQTIAKSPQDMVVRVVASGNQIRGEEIRGSLELYKNSIIFQPHEFILARSYRIDGSQKGVAEEALMDFLTGVNQTAQARGILPDPIRGTVGVIEAAQFYDVVSRIQPYHDGVVLSAYAREATNALGPLRLDVKVERIDEENAGVQP
ncbi:DUF3084 domain-containing protein [uncultured Selenomonas sp.]|uniref:DUF3084 domain-containing protein n=1 Tax=uncultured Selenomonas sp. TaxID=159275 RepID=UPI0025F60633|nr:DUF3084 domain-containing protein [uncultured Selenomonas sp.]